MVVSQGQLIIKNHPHKSGSWAVKRMLLWKEAGGCSSARSGILVTCEEKIVKV